MTMSGATARRRFAAPTLAMLPRVSDSLSFLYLDVVRIVQDDTGVCALIARDKGNPERVYVPTAALSCVLLGPGTSITQRALTTFARHGTTVVCTGAGGVRCYAGVLPEGLSTTWLEHQVAAYADPARRLDVAIRMYEQRFETPVPPGTTIQQLRGMEGQRVKAYYRLMAAQHRVKRFKRQYDAEDWAAQDPVNLALSEANTCLYGIVHAAILALGCSPALGFVHQGKQHAFVYDIADLYKAQLTIPLAFSLHNSHDPASEARRRLRDELRLFRLMPRVVQDIQRLLNPDHTPTEFDELDIELVSLWDPVVGALPAGVNYATDDA